MDSNQKPLKVFWPYENINDFSNEGPSLHKALPKGSQARLHKAFAQRSAGRSFNKK